MMEEQISKMRRRMAHEVVGSEIAVETAMSEEWWRGFYAGQRQERGRCATIARTRAGEELAREIES